MYGDEGENDNEDELSAGVVADTGEVGSRTPRVLLRGGEYRYFEGSVVILGRDRELEPELEVDRDVHDDPGGEGDRESGGGVGGIVLTMSIAFGRIIRVSRPYQSGIYLYLVQSTRLNLHSMHNQYMHRPREQRERLIEKYASSSYVRRI